MKLRTITSIAIMIAFVCAPSIVHAQGGFGPPELTLDEVRDNIYTIRNASSGNVTMLVGSEGVVLIDDKFPQDHDGIIEFVQSVTDAPVRYVIVTHMHPDHAGGNPEMHGLGASIISSENARGIMVERGTPGLPDITTEDHLRVYLDDMPIDLYHLGHGHTNGDVVVHLPTERIIVSGDLFALYSPYRAVIDYSAGGSLRDWTQTLDRVLRLDFDTVIPGHSGVTDRANVEGYRDYLAEMQETVREMNGDRRSREEIQAVLESEFNWGGLELLIGLDGVIAEMQ